VQRLSPYAYNLPDGSSTTFNRLASPAEKTARRLVSRMGSTQPTLCVWRLPDGADLFDLDDDEWPKTFLQAAGTAEAMTIEWRRLDDDGEERLYVVGHGGLRQGEPNTPVDVNYGGDVIKIHPDEVFDADEAGDILVTYLHTERVPDKYALRLLNLGTPPSAT